MSTFSIPVENSTFLLADCQKALATSRMPAPASAISLATTGQWGGRESRSQFHPHIAQEEHRQALLSVPGGIQNRLTPDLKLLRLADHQPEAAR
jgi:hypothetical protein